MLESADLASVVQHISPKHTWSPAAPASPSWNCVGTHDVKFSCAPREPLAHHSTWRPQRTARKSACDAPRAGTRGGVRDLEKMVQRHGRKLNRRVAASNNFRGPCQRQQQHCKHQWLHGAIDSRIISFLFGGSPPRFDAVEKEGGRRFSAACNPGGDAVCGKLVLYGLHDSAVRGHGNAAGARGKSALCVLDGQYVMLTHTCVGQVCARVRAHAPTPTPTCPLVLLAC